MRGRPRTADRGLCGRPRTADRGLCGRPRTAGCAVSGRGGPLHLAWAQGLALARARLGLVWGLGLGPGRAWLGPGPGLGSGPAWAQARLGPRSSLGLALVIFCNLDFLCCTSGETPGIFYIGATPWRAVRVEQFPGYFYSGAASVADLFTAIAHFPRLHSQGCTNVEISTCTTLTGVAPV